MLCWLRETRRGQILESSYFPPPMLSYRLNFIFNKICILYTSNLWLVSSVAAGAALRDVNGGVFEGHRNSK